MLSKGPVVTILVLMVVTCLIRSSRAQSGLDLVDVDFLYIGAHPDDELHANATMARYVLDQGFRGAVITFTRGEGGGNAIGPETGPALGLIRTEELRRSLETIGIDTFYFTGQNDFYFTQFAEETQERWGDQFICDVARIVRLTRPEVIITMWPGPGTHGHHQLAARASTRIFDNANDPNFCPEQLSEEFINLWQPLKLYYADFSPPLTSPVSSRFRPTTGPAPPTCATTTSRCFLSVTSVRKRATSLNFFRRGLKIPARSGFFWRNQSSRSRSRKPISLPEQ